MSTHGHWNYRVVKYADEDGTYAIHEAHYRAGEHLPYTLTVEAVGISGDTIKEMQRDLINYQGALSLPVLAYNTREEIETPLGTKLKRAKK